MAAIAAERWYGLQEVRYDLDHANHSLPDIVGSILCENGTKFIHCKTRII